jgi:enoyl-CoA hydratase
MPVEYELRDGVARLTLDDGKANAISPDLLDELNRALDRVDADGTVRAVVVAGRPGRFCAGFDLAAMTAGGESMRQLVAGGARLAARLLLQPQPVVAACTGHALAMGALLLLVADHRVGAAGEYRIGLNEVAIGMPMPRWGVELATYRLAPTHLTRCLVLGEVGGPEEARAAGFLDQLVPASSVRDEAEAVASRLAGLRTKAVAGTKARARSTLMERMLADLDADLDGVDVPSQG